MTTVRWPIVLITVLGVIAVLSSVLILLFVLRAVTLPKSSVIVRNRDKVAVEACTLLVESEFWWDQERHIGPLSPGSSVLLRLHRLDESNFVINCRFEDGQTRSAATANFWDPAPGDSTVVLELAEDGLLVDDAQGSPLSWHRWSERPIRSTWRP